MLKSLEWNPIVYYCRFFLVLYQAIVCATDNLALGVRKYLTDKTITDIKVSGVGNNELMEFFYKDHISVNLSYKQAGTKAANLIFDMVNNISVDKLIVMESELIKD